MIGCRILAVFFLTLGLIGCGAAPQATSSSTSTQTSQSNGSAPATTSSSPTPTGPTIPANATTIADIQKMPNWSSCSSNCAGEAGTNAIYSMEQAIASPSVSGAAIKFDITGGTPWADALWWKQVGGNDAITHFVYKISFYLDKVDAAQALEFNVNQNAGGMRYEYASQCDIKGSGHWRIWPHAQMHWLDTGIPCPAPQQNAWNQLTWEFSRNAQNQVVWEAVTLNGQRSAIGQSFDGFAATGSGIDVAFQMDSDGGPTPWSVWVDDVSLTEW